MSSSWRIPILYLFLGVLVAVSVVPLYFYGSNVVAINRDRLKTNEMLLQNTITSSLRDDLAQRHQNLLAMLGNLATAIEVTSGGNLTDKHEEAPDLRARLQQVVSATPAFATGQDLTRYEIVRNFVVQPQAQQVVETKEFTFTQNGRTAELLGTYSPVPSLNWAVVAQKPQDAAYASIFEMQRAARWLALWSALISVLVAVFAARKITTPLLTLTEQSRAIARGDFSRRVQLRSRTEIGELAQTFNLMSDGLERFVADLKRAADENLA